MALVDATPEDIPAIMAIERDPAYGKVATSNSPWCAR